MVFVNIATHITPCCAVEYVPEEDYELPLGKAEVVKEGTFLWCHVVCVLVGLICVLML